MLDSLVIQKTLRVPTSSGPSGDGRAVARQLDGVLAQVGFKASGELLRHVSGLAAPAAMDLAVLVIGAVRELVGDHVGHNPYFKDFPRGVPDTMDFWVRSLREAFVTADDGTDRFVPTDAESADVLGTGWVDLLALPGYGRTRHTYEEVLAAHDELIPSVKDRVTVVHLGGTPAQEAQALYLALAGSPVPLGETDLALLGELAAVRLDGEQPATIPVRENRAVVNAARLAAARPLVAVDTVTDVLRLACHVSDGDVTLREPTRFRSFRRPERRGLMAALDEVVAAGPGKLGDIATYRRRWQRLGERLHPHEHGSFPHAQDVFAVARGAKHVRSSAGKVESAFADGAVLRAVELLSVAPGMLLRRIDRVLRSCEPHQVEDVLEAVVSVIGGVSGRVLCSVREHLANRPASGAMRTFVNRNRRAWVTADERPPLDPVAAAGLTAVLDGELLRRLPAHQRLVVDPEVLALALPLSDKETGDGFGVVPRGSETPVDGELLRFFAYWRQHSRSTDHDLSALLLDDDFGLVDHVSWTNYSSDGAYYSGDLTDAADGATEFIDIPLDTVSARYVVPQVDVFSGEGFDTVAESMFGFMTRDRTQRGRPFEAGTVRMRSAMRGSGRVALPVVFRRDDDGSWSAKWLHLYLRGTSWGNRVEGNQGVTGLLARAVFQRAYLTVGYLVDRLRAKAGSYTTWAPGTTFTEPVTFIGIERPENLPAGSEVFTLATLKNLVPQ
ncbi:hypothetical protein FHS29_000279 [Saccharothrix tamanrassetensis]|uniref:TerD domain-containing protein n=1 Tax=Saccharothrix tamanrassetensis TaxID=1051531 RepID=A0A841C8H3_9PSEU|nr:hypothetical protein [Saccharothrix tamanrassetensis]MBB5953709.1 hypothetical protein [Saccharothrix tamanrassetensis]